MGMGFVHSVKQDLVSNAKFRQIDIGDIDVSSQRWGESANKLMVRVANFDRLSLADRLEFVTRTQLGTKEQPANSNWGPQVSKYIEACGITAPTYWCACFVTWSLIHALYDGKFPPLKAFVPSWEEWAKKNGLWVAPSKTRQGDLLIFQFDVDPQGDHIGICTSVLSPTQRRTIEGNTSPDDAGSQSNGGMVCAKTRPLSVIKGGIRLKD